MGNANATIVRNNYSQKAIEVISKKFNIGTSSGQVLYGPADQDCWPVDIQEIP